MGGYGVHGVLEHYDAVLVYYMAAILKFFKFHLKKTCLFEQYFCGRHLGKADVKFCKRIYGLHGSHIEILKMTSSP